MPYNGDYRARLKEVAKFKGYHLNELSYSIDRNKGYLSDVIRGKQKLRVDELERLCEEMNIALEDFFETGYKSEVFLDLLYEARKHDDDVLSPVFELLRRVGGTRPGR